MSYLESKVEQQRYNQADTDDNRSSDGIEITTAASVDQALSPHVHAVTPGASEHGNKSVHESKTTSDVVVDTSSVVKTEAERTKEHADVLPLDESTLVSEPDLGFHLDGSRVFDPEGWFFDARRELALSTGSGILGSAEGRQKVGEARAGRCWLGGAVVADASLIFIGFLGGLGVLFRHVGG
jgi:hypothetical protein